MLNESQGFIPVSRDESKPFISTAEPAEPPLNVLVMKPEINRNSFKENLQRENTKPRPCRPVVVPFDTEKVINVYLRLEYLKNLDSEDLPHPGDYVVRVSFMGQTYGHFPSGNMDLHSMVNYARSDPSQRRSPDLFLSQELNFCIKFKDLVDNPLVFHLCFGGGDVVPENYNMIQPFGYICLDVARILNYKTGLLAEYIEPWIIPDPSKAQGLNVQVNPAAPIPTLQFSLECMGGLPDSLQFHQGNMMTVLCESLHNMPPHVQQNVTNADYLSDVQVYMTLPYSPNEPILKFAGGNYRDGSSIEPVIKKLSLQDEGTQTPGGMGVNGKPPKSDHELVTMLGNQAKAQAANNPRFWASIKDVTPDTPTEATLMAFDAALDPPDSDESDIYGDGREDYMEFNESGDGRVMWNSVHRKYIGVDAYRQMLAKLSQNAVWPVEIAVCVKKKSDVKKKGPSRSKSIFQNSAPAASSTTPAVEKQGSQASILPGTDPERMIMSELGQPSNTLGNANDFTLIFHGIAFVDLSCLVFPGTKSARFACRVYSFSNDLLARRTCISGSGLPENLLLTLTPKAMAENKLKPPSKPQPAGQASVAAGGNKRTSIAEQSVHRKSDIMETGSRPGNKVPGVEIATGDGTSSQERHPFIVFRISMLRSIVPCYKTNEISKVVDEFLPRRQLMRRKLLNASTSEQKYRKAVLEAAAELSHEFSEHYWKDVLQNGSDLERANVDPSSNEAVKKGFIFYLNASGRYLILREHLRSAISHVVQQKCLNLRPSGFQNHRDFQSYLHDMYVFLVDEMHEIMHSSSLQETDPLKSNLDRLLQQTNCGPDEEFSKASLHQRQITDLGIFAEEAFAQGDFETCHRLHLQRICKDKESARCWTEFGIMWLSRGDDRMAEIAVREALRKDPLHLCALIIAGVISVRHGDERGIECLGAALGLRPMSPEILVIVGMANSLIGNHIAADYFFRKAAYVHRIITGQSTQDLEKLFNEKNARRVYNMKEFTKDMDDDTLLLKSPAAVTQESSQIVTSSPVAEEIPGGDSGSAKKEKSKVRQSKNEMDGSVKKTKTMKNQEDGKTEKGSLKRKGSSLKEKAPSKTSQTGQAQLETVVPPPPKSSSNGPKFSFLENLNDIQLEEVELPLLSPSIQSPWNVTDYTEKMEGFLLNAGKPQPKRPSKTGSSLETQNTKSVSSMAHSTHERSDGGETIKGEIGVDALGSSGSSDKNKKKNKTKGAESTSTLASSSKKSSSRKRKEKGQGDISKSQNILSPINEETEAEDTSATSKPVVVAKSVAAPVPDQPKLTNRLGSELIWTASLLINLRLFDFLDGVLAKHLFFYEKRSIQYIYLRALSFYLRQREDEALPFIKEALEIDGMNGMYWALEGHCHYNLGNIPEALASYEKALKLPHVNENRHLLYLRYGSLVLDSGKTKLAKRVFLHGVSKYPTPYMWLALGSACFQRLEYDQAESSFSEANRLDSTNPITWGHLALSSLMQNKQALAEQAYKWAIRFGLKKGILMDEIHRIQKEKEFGDPSFPRVPTCVPHDYYLRRMGKQRPFNIYKEALNQDPPRMAKNRYEDTENEALLKRKLELMSNAAMQYPGEEWEGEEEGYYEMPPVIEEEEIVEEEQPPQPLEAARKGKRGKKEKSEKGTKEMDKSSGPPEVITIKNPPGHTTSTV